MSSLAWQIRRSQMLVNDKNDNTKGQNTMALIIPLYHSYSSRRNRHAKIALKYKVKLEEMITSLHLTYQRAFVFLISILIMSCVHF